MRHPIALAQVKNGMPFSCGLPSLRRGAIHRQLFKRLTRLVEPAPGFPLTGAFYGCVALRRLPIARVIPLKRNGGRHVSVQDYSNGYAQLGSSSTDVALCHGIIPMLNPTSLF